MLEFKRAGQALGQGFIGAGQVGNRQCGGGRVHIQGFLGKRRVVPARLALLGCSTIGRIGYVCWLATNR